MRGDARTHRPFRSSKPVHQGAAEAPCVTEALRGLSEAEEAARSVVVYFPDEPHLGPGHPLEQARKRLEALDRFPWTPPAGNT